MKKQTDNQEKLKNVIINNLLSRTYDTKVLKAMQMMSICESRELKEFVKKNKKVNDKKK